MTDLEQHLSDQAEKLNRFERFFWHRVRSEYAISAIQRYVGPCATVLDIGAGAGVFGSHFVKACPEGRYVFVEQIELLARQLRLRFTAAADWSYKDHFDADVVVLLDVIEHWEQDVLSLKNLSEKLRKGTIVVVMCPALPLLWSEWDVKLGHFRRYTDSSLRQALESAGLSVLECRYLFQCMTLLGLLRKAQKFRSSEFPEISDRANSILYRLTKIEAAVCRWAPFGSSVAAVCRKQDLLCPT